jgi:hypothetical protein
MVGEGGRKGDGGRDWRRKTAKQQTANQNEKSTYCCCLISLEPAAFSTPPPSSIGMTYDRRIHSDTAIYLPLSLRAQHYKGKALILR